MSITESAWNAFSRVNASQRWRKPSAAMGRQMTEAIVAEARVEQGMRVLDVACGSGEPAISIATLLQGTGEVVGVDISPGPLKVAESRAAERGLKNVRFQPADVHALPFGDNEFDRITSRLGVMFFAEAGKAFREMHRVLKPGGRASILAWGPREQPYFETTIGAVLRAAPELTFPQSGAKMFKFGGPEVLAKALREAGFASVEARTESIPWNWPGTPEELWEYFQEVTIPFKPLFESIPEEKRAEVNAKVVEAIGKLYDGREVKFQARIVLASAGK